MLKHCFLALPLKIKIHREGTNILIILLLILAVVNISAWMFIRPAAIPIVFSSISLIVYLLILNFFRSPRRHFPGDPENLVVSSVDGTVVALEETFEHEYLKRPAIQLSVFMTILNVHANWFPVNGFVLKVRHFKGRYMSAYLPKSSIENEHSSILIKSDNGALVVANQVAGAVARRIVTYAKPNEDCSIEDHMGFIKFGSRVDIFLPLDAEILVKIGDKTTGGITPVARLKPQTK